MSGKNIHGSPFDEGTLLKLDIFHQYLKECFPVFMRYQYQKTGYHVNIVDFFAGQGKDSTGKAGSPILILETLKFHLNEIKESGTSLVLKK